MIDTEATAHRERGLVLTLTMNSTVMLELIRIACVNQFEDLVWGPFLSVNLLNKWCLMPMRVEEICQFKSKLTKSTNIMLSFGK